MWAPLGATEEVVMRRPYQIAVVLSLFLFFGLLVGPVSAATDVDIPGMPLAIGDMVSGTVDSGDVDDVYAITLAVGQEVHIRCDPGSGSGSGGALHLLVPGASSISDPGKHEELTYRLSGGSYIRFWADYDYIPARSGTYHLWVEWEEGDLGYELSVERTTRPALSLALDSDEIPGTTIGSATVTGVVSSKADPSDVYAFPLTAGVPTTIQLIPLAPYNNTNSSFGYLSLLDPDTTSISQRYSHRVGDRVSAKNSNDPVSCETAVIQHTPDETGTYYVLVEPGVLGSNFAYQLSVSGADGGGGEGDGGDGFSDVPGSPYADAIYDLAGRGIITGFQDQTFRPDASVTRQQFAKMIVKTLGLTVTGSEICPFTDVPGQIGTDPLYPSKYVAVCASSGITTGKTPTTFDPESNITHQQLITMVARAADLPELPAGFSPPFSSGQFSLEEHYGNACKAAYAGLLDGLLGIGATYDFLAASTRGECAQILHNLLQEE